jgi:hypothetical protein
MKLQLLQRLHNIMGARPLADYKKNQSSSEIKEEDEVNAEEHQEEEVLTPEKAVASYKLDFAKKLGWTTKEEWDAAGRDPDMHREVDDFLDSSPQYFQHLRKKVRDQENRMKRSNQAAAAALEDERRRGREEAEREAREAATAGDPERAAAAVKKAVEAGPPPETVAWINRNGWFNEDPIAQAAAVAEVNRMAARGATNIEQLEAAEALVKKRFPEYFEDESYEELPEFITKKSEPPKREVKMSESKVVAQAANSTTSARVKDSRQSKEKTFKDIPAQDQAQYKKFFERKFMGRGMTAEQAQDRYARTYFGNQGE